MTFAIPENLHKLMKKHSEIKWAEIARQTIKQKAEELNKENFEWKRYAQKHAVEKGWNEASELFKFWARRYCCSANPLL